MTVTGSRAQVRRLTLDDVSAAVQLCHLDPAANVYVAARLLEAREERLTPSALGFFDEHGLQGLCWTSANIVPAHIDARSAGLLADELRRRGPAVSSIFGPAAQVELLWGALRRSWPEAVDVRGHQPLMAIGPGDPLGARPDRRVRVARPHEIEQVLPASEAMFTEEIGYTPYSDDAGSAVYRSMVRGLLRRGHTLVLDDGDGRIVFKADIGSVGVGACQIQGVWVAPRHRGRGLAAPAMAAVVEHARRHIAPLVTLYVNDYNLPALATYHRVGFVETGAFSTVLF